MLREMNGIMLLASERTRYLRAKLPLSGSGGEYDIRIGRAAMSFRRVGKAATGEKLFALLAAEFAKQGIVSRGRQDALAGYCRIVEKYVMIKMTRIHDHTRKENATMSIRR